ncbi:MAG: DUF4860 domain-containing protein [Clostridiales Family XIII bacterium]|jgi:hypothetical protein|nr:DUF4860 domain-containing protein [Clostridiales Family XIII bacterium]
MGGKKHFINLIFTLTLLGVFAMSALLVAVMGAQVYESSAENVQKNFDTRTSLVYMAQKVRQSPAGGIRVGSVDGGDALVLSESYDDETYESWIYVYDNELREVLVPAGAPVKAGDGYSIMELKSLKIEERGGLLLLTAENKQGEEHSLSLARRVSAEGAAS